ncbi:hypothetical protein [Chryseobacterium sp. SL1]|uniref:hypothetical protein n=1 Tax=Chryseobacterium sp. SL1 TaxID=2995159 RepID=UPI002273AE13|nr:hypothetical protein [Chryseobacterium sp. SL1]MCY1660765.1 hypothetical protein [Chryseobacterium sp. SL1]
MEITLRCIDKKPEDWHTFNDKMYTKIVDNNYKSTKVYLLPNELPILECDLNDSYLLVTSNRVISMINNNFYEIYPNDFYELCNDYEKFNYKKEGYDHPKTNIICIEKVDGRKVLLKVDSDYPSFFTKILIYNIMLYKKEGRWYLNPSKKNHE